MHILTKLNELLAFIAKMACIQYQK